MILLMQRSVNASSKNTVKRRIFNLLELPREESLSRPKK